MIKKHSKEELKEIQKKYGHWDDSKNQEWVYDLTKERLEEMEGLFGERMDELFNDRLEQLNVKKSSIKIWTIEKLLDHANHSNPYVQSRINDYEIKNFDQETEFRIIFEEIEKHFKTEFIENRIFDYKLTSANEELATRQLLADCEMHTNDYVAERIVKYKPKDLEQEVFFRIKLEECEKFNSPFILKQIKKYMGKIEPNEELHKRIILSECEKHTTKWVEKRIKDFDQQTFETEGNQDLHEQLKFREDLEQCETINSNFVKSGIEFWTKYGFEIKTPEEELDARLTLQECEKYNTDYISREIKRMKDEYLIRNPKEELKHRMNLEFYEKNIKDEEKEGDEKGFWDMLSINGLENMKILKRELDEVGKGFCLAKWNQVSILLQTGQTHSCHHPSPHVVPREEVAKNPSALHNTEFKKLQRKTMLAGGRPKECDYCWNVEDANPDSFSDRHLKSGEAWAFPYFDRIKKSDPSADVQPSYVEISFSNQCNLACGYCDVKSSSRWQSEIASKGPYPTSGMFNNTDWMDRENSYPIAFNKPNPYVEAFWKWWPDLFPKLHTFRITGGEPLLSKDTFKVLDYIIENPSVNPMIEISVNSNLCAPQDRFDEFVDKVKYITENDLVWNFSLFTSIEAWAERAEYMRDGLVADTFWNNLDTFLTKCEKPEATIMATYNLTSVSSYDKVIKKVFELKKKHYNGKRYRHYSIILDTAYLRHPEFLQIRLLSTYWIDKIREDVKLMDSLSEEKYTHIYGHGHCGYYDFEREKLRRLLDWVDEPIDDITWLIKQRKDFALYIDEFDKRRNKNFLETFPEMEDFYNSCKKLI